MLLRENNYYAEFIQWKTGWPVWVTEITELEDKILAKYTISRGKNFGKTGEAIITQAHLDKWEEWKKKQDEIPYEGPICHAGLII